VCTLLQFLRQGSAIATYFSVRNKGLVTIYLCPFYYVWSLRDTVFHFVVKNEIACPIARIIRKLFVVVAKLVVRDELVRPTAGFQLDKP
jgi:hypothetical protein